MDLESRVTNRKFQVEYADNKLFCVSEQIGISGLFYSLQCFRAFLCSRAQEECEAFTKTNALFNAYPYLREYVSSEFIRMWMQGVYLPLLKLPNLVENKSPL